MPLVNPENTIVQVKRLIESESRTEIKLHANGGNSILIVCNPIRELEYIQQINAHFKNDRYDIIDLNLCLIEFINDNKEDILNLYPLLQSSTHEIFRAPEGEESNDLFKLIITKIETSFKDNKIPVLINLGALYATGIHTIHIMENNVIMEAHIPILILYPATNETDRLMFLGKQPASKYRCMIIQ